MFASVRSFVALVLALACAGAGAQSLVPVTRAGGQISQPVAVGDYLYVPAGVGLDVWSLADPAHPVHVGRTGASDEAPGPIDDVVAISGHLYAVWRNIDSGVAVYSLDDPAHPARVGAIDDVSAERLGGDSEHLYLAGDAIGVLSYDVSDPDHPAALGTVDSFVAGYVSAFGVGGNRAFLVTSDAFGMPHGWFIDLADPAHLHATPILPICGTSCLVDGNYVISPSWGFSVFDAHDPGNPMQSFTHGGSPFSHGALADDIFWLFADDGVEAWDVSAPAQPVILGDAAIDLPGVTRVASTPHGPFSIDFSGNGTLVDASTPASPRVLARFDVPGSGSVQGAALDSGCAYLADSLFGLRILTAPALEPIASLAIGEGDLRGAMAVAVADGVAYVVGFGTLYAVDVADPQHPSVIGSVAMESFFVNIAIDGDRAYLAAYNQATPFRVIDIADPAQMHTMGSLTFDYPHDLVARDGLVFTASEGGLTLASGLRVIDASNPNEPVQIGADESCAEAGLATSVAFLDDRTNVLAIGCYDGSVHLVDVSVPENPVEVGSLQVPDDFNAALSLRSSGHRLFVGHIFGVDEFDVADASTPRRAARYETGSPVYTLRGAPDALLAVTVFAGTYSYAMPSMSSPRPHSHHARPARSFEP
jgi:hypothetical protein